MSAIKDALAALRDAVALVEEVKKAGAQISSLAGEIRDLDRRVARLEGRWEATLDLAQLHARRPARLSKKGSDE